MVLMEKEELQKKKKKLKHKFKAVRSESDGIKFSSKLERDFYEKLKLLEKSGEVIFFLRQVPFDLGGKVKYFCDFQVFYADDTVEFIDTKGIFTAQSKQKIKQVEHFYPVKIRIVQRDEVYTSKKYRKAKAD